VTSRWSRNPEVLWRRCGEKIVMLVPGSADPIVLEGSGERAWELLADPIDSEDLAVGLAELYDTDVRTVEQDLESFLGELETVGAAARER